MMYNCNIRATKEVALKHFYFQSPATKPGNDSSQLASLKVPLVPTETTIPTNVHLDLQRTGHIADPHLGLNEKDVQWIHDRDWVYQTEFTVDEEWNEDLLAGRCTMELICEGLDTFAIIRVNGHEIARTDNMFIEYRFLLKPEILQLNQTDKNKLEIIFQSPMKLGNKIMEDNGGQRVTWNGHYSRNFVRKAQFHYGWDWGPSLVTSGPWKPISIVYSFARIDSPLICPTFRSSTDLTHVNVRFDVPIIGSLPLSDTTLTVTLSSPTGIVTETALRREECPSSPTRIIRFTGTADISNPELWYPTGYGEQNIYNVKYVLRSRNGGAVIDVKTHTTGFRYVELVQDNLGPSSSNPVTGGRSFYFKVNNVPIYTGGSNWIPADTFLPRISKAKLTKLIKTYAHDVGNQNVLRVWGGGIYESDDFYDICDELGIMVWQDICLACGDYPANLQFWRKSIEREVKYQISARGLRNRPSLVIWAGNNEDYQVADEELGYEKSELPGSNGENWIKSKFPSRWLYERVFPRIIGEEYGVGWKGIGGFNGDGVEESVGLGRIIYWPGSPWGGQDSSDRTMGDVHQWNVWGGIGAPYQRYHELGGRFNSEFGMLSYPSISTIFEAYLPSSPYSDLASATEDPEFHPQSMSSEYHQRAHSFEKRFMAYLGENFRVGFNSYQEYVHLSQLLQSEAMGYAFRGWRRLWGGNSSTGEKGRLCGGALVWQLNDVWPVTSWSLIDSFLRPKPALYTIARALAPIALGIQRITTPNPKPNGKVEALVSHRTVKEAMSGGQFALHSTPHIFPPQQSQVVVWVASKLLEERNLKALGWCLEIIYVDLDSGIIEHVFRVSGCNSIVIAPNGTTTVWQQKFDEPTPSYRVIHAYLSDEEGNVFARHTDWPQPLKHYEFSSSDRRINITRKYAYASSGVCLGHILITVEKPVKGFWMDHVDGIIWSEENGSDICPGDPVTIVANLEDSGVDELQRKEKWGQVETATYWYYGITGLDK